MSAAAPAAPPPPRRRLWPRVLAIVLAVIVILLLAVAAGVYWVLSTPSGAQFVFGKVSGMLGQGARIEGVEGRLGGELRIKTIDIDRPDLYVHVDDVLIETAPLAPLGGRLDVHRLVARNVEVRTASSGAAARVPVSFKPPYPIRLEDGRVGTLRYAAMTPAEKAAKDPAAKRAAREAARSKDLVLRDIVLKGEGDRSRWAISEAAAATEYGQARVKGTLGTTSPFAVAMDGDFAGRLQDRAVHVAAKVRGTLKSLEADAEAELAGTRASARATLEPFATQPVKSVQLDARAVDLAQVRPGLPATRLDVAAKLAPQGKDAFAGPVSIDNAAPGAWDRGRLPFTRAAANARVASDGRVELAQLEVALLGGGAASGNATLAGGRVTARLEVADLDLAALDGALQKTSIGGTLDASGDESSQRFAVALEDPRFGVEGRAVLAAQRLDVETVTVRTGGGAVTAKGGMALSGQRDFRFEGRAEHFDPSAFVKTAAGDLNFAFTATGTAAGGVSGEARVDIAPSRYAGLPASGHVYVAGNGERIAKGDVHLALGEAHVDARGSFGGAGDALDVALHAPDLSTLAKPFGVALAGKVDAEGRLTGTLHAPAGRISLQGANLELPSNVHVGDVTLRAEAGSAPDSAIDVSVLAHGVALGKETPPTPLAETLRVTLQGTRSAHALQLEAQVTQEATLKAALRGGIDPRAAAVAWNGRLESLSLTGRGAFALAAPATLAASAQRIELGDATLRGEWGEARLQVTRWTPATLEVRGATPGIQIQNLARSLRLGNAARSTLVVAGEWNIHAAENFDATLDLHRLSGDLRVGNPPLPLGLQDLVVKAEVNHGRARVELRIAGDRIGRVQGDGSALVVRGSKGWEIARDAPVAAHVVADVPDLASLAEWLGPEAKAGGRLMANVSVSGTGADPRLAGEVRAQDLMLREPQTGFELEHGEVALRLDGRALTIDRLTAQTPWRPPEGATRKLPGAAGHAPGTIEAQGSLDLAARQGEIRIRLAQVPVTQLPKRFVALSGDARLEATKQGVLASATLKADAGWIGALETPPPSVSEDVVVVRAAVPPQPQAKPGIGERITVDARFDLGEQLHFEGRGLDTRLAGNLRVTGAPPVLRATGSVRTVGGTYDAYGQKLTIERGVLVFSGPIDNPQLNVRAVRTGLPVEAGVEVLGSASHLRVRLVSAPDVPEPEKLSWLVLGRGPSDLGPGDASLLVSAATSMLGKDPGGNIGQKFGIDEVGIGRSSTNSVLGVLPQSTVAGRTGTASAAEVVTVGKKITRTVHLTYEQGLSDAEGTLKLAWTLTRHFELLARAGYLPGLDAVYRWTFE